MKRQLIVSALVFAVFAGSGVAYRLATASDHDDGENDIKARSLNLTDHYVFRAPDAPNTHLALVMYINPRSLAGYQYLMSTQARYEFNVARVGVTADKGKKSRTTPNITLRFEGGAAAASGVQPVTLTVLQDGAAIATGTGNTTPIGAHLATPGAVTTNNTTVGAETIAWFIGPRADTFHFDVIRYFQVRNFLANRFFGGTDGNGNASAALDKNCKGQAFLGGDTALNLPGEVAEGDGDELNLFNPPECAPDFTKNYNVTAIVAKVPYTVLRSAGGSETVFDTWSTVSIPK